MANTEINMAKIPDKSTYFTLQNNKEKGIILLDPLALHHSDTPGLILVITLLNRRNYREWCRSIRRNLNAKNKLDLIDGSIEAPPTTDAKFLLWQCYNDLVEPITCSCDMLKKIANKEEKEKVMQFLMGLNEPFPKFMGQP
ncbi:hypothetical protein DKX38_011144 [Salix brachista]|uniref:Retrotransposon Copia-like N-terminal domain-containing protein n=1 Tax=Salix brachista TaxID=2182728 RepID=A0A5N5LYN1_9ROSI|nr:hypothetical protein DKX38_011144 [Salix brachista]